MTTTPQAALLREAAQNALITLDGIASANPRDKADFETPDEWIAWAKSRARWAADALRTPVAQEIYAERILRQMLHEASQATQVPVHAGSASLLDVCKSIMDSIAVSSSVIEHNRQEPVQAEPTLRDYADSLIKAGHDFWKACRREAGGGAVRWISCDDGTLVVFTRGEYRDTIMENIGCYKAPEVFFEEDGITAAESKEPVQAGELPDEREAFEATVLKDNHHAVLTKRRNGCYQDDELQSMWWAWQARAALAARKPLTCGDLNPDRIFGLADVHADESQEDGRRIFDRDGLVGFAMDAARIGAYPATAPLTKAQIKDLAQDEELLLICDGLDSLEDIVSVIERAHGIGLEVKP